MLRSLEKGPPGISCTRKKVIVTTQKSTTSIEAKRRMMKASTWKAVLVGGRDAEAVARFGEIAFIELEADEFFDLARGGGDRGMADDEKGLEHHEVRAQAMEADAPFGA